MKLIAPNYYLHFSCIADRCKHSCCIGWEIDIDDETLAKYQMVSGAFGERLRAGIYKEDEMAHFCLSESEKCPFLNETGLCDIILNLGEDYLSQICTDHPRFCAFYSDRTEIGLGLCCEEAGRLILSQKEKTTLLILEDDGEDEALSEEEIAFFEMRESLFALAQNREVPFDARIENILSLVGVELPQKNFGEWVDIYLSLERMNDAWTALLEKARIVPDTDAALIDEISWEQLLVYFLYRHLCDTDAPKKSVAFAVLSVRMIRELCKRMHAIEADMIEICRLYSSEIEYSEENTVFLKDYFYSMKK